MRPSAMLAKGAPGLECRTYTRLVSPAIGREKIKWNPLFFDKIRYLEFNYTLYNIPPASLKLDI